MMGSWSMGAPLRVVGTVLVLGSAAAIDLVADREDPSGPGWVCLDLLQRPDGQPRDGFGSSVLWHGDRLLIGAPYDDGSAPDAGAVVVYDRTVDDFVATWRPSGLPASAHFGGTLVPAGTAVLVGSPYSAHGWLRPSSVDWVSLLLDGTSGHVIHQFGGARAASWHEGPVAVAADGTHLVVGVPNAAAADRPGVIGTVQVREQSSGRLVAEWWGEAPPGERPTFGTSVAIAGDRVFVGDPFRSEADAGVVDVFRIGRAEAEATLRFEGPDAPYYFGGGLATDGAHLVVAATGYRELHVFEIDRWGERIVIPAPRPAAAPEWGTTMRFGASGLLVSGSGWGPWSDWIESGVRHDVTVVDVPRGEIRSAATFTPFDARTGFGYSFDEHPDGTLAIGAPRLGAQTGMGGGVFLARPTTDGEAPVPCQVPELLSEDACVHGTDRDGDGLSDAEEQRLGLDPCVVDTDADNLADGLEVTIYGSDPLASDTDGDGLSDHQEVYATRTDALRADSDGDGFGDGCEARAGSDPRSPGSVPPPDAIRVDCITVPGALPVGPPGGR